MNDQYHVLIQNSINSSDKSEFLEKLNKPLTVKIGFDPTSSDLHFGHVVLLEKAKQFQNFGHQIVFLIGDYTALIGDPTGRNVLRPRLTKEQIEENATTYLNQCFKILDRKKTIVRYNSEWLKHLSFHDMIDLCSRYNLARMLERRDFKTRFEENNQICMHELLYPLIQGYDSVWLKADIELGGSDQIFNLNVGRDLMKDYASSDPKNYASSDLKYYGLDPQLVLTTPLLLGLDGKEKMSKSKGNHIGILEDPKSVFTKIMSIADETMWQWIPLLTNKLPELNKPAIDCKKSLAFDMIEKFHSKDIAIETINWWNDGRKSDLKLIEIESGKMLFEIIHEIGAAKSNSDAKRKIQQGGIYINGERSLNEYEILYSGSYEIKVGKHFEIKLEVK